MNIKQILAEEIDNFACIGFPALMQRFVMRNGSVMVPIDEMPDDVGRGEIKQCFMNATNLAQLGYQYVEGFAFRQNLPILIHHAWVVDNEGRVIDNTWNNPENCLYMGVEFDFEVLCREITRNEVYGLLDTGYGINVNLLFEMDEELKQYLDDFQKKRQML